jgi:small subunit ribosomal protein S8
MMTDPLGDMLTRIRNAARARHAETQCSASRLRRAVAEVLRAEGFLSEVRVDEDEKVPVLHLAVRYQGGRPVMDGIRRVSRPGRRVYVKVGEIRKVRSGLGVAVLSTPRGVLSDRAAREQNVGGELLCEVW